MMLKKSYLLTQLVDALSDTKFLSVLAEANKSKFSELLE